MNEEEAQQILVDHCRLDLGWNRERAGVVEVFQELLLLHESIGKPLGQRFVFARNLK
jgi:hypothetical protein